MLHFEDHCFVSQQVKFNKESEDYQWFSNLNVYHRSITTPDIPITAHQTNKKLQRNLCSLKFPGIHSSVLSTKLSLGPGMAWRMKCSSGNLSSPKAPLGQVMERKYCLQRSLHWWTQAPKSLLGIQK